MKKLFLLTALAAALAFTACKKEDTSVDVTQLAGTWANVNDHPDFADLNGSNVYTFRTDGSYEYTRYFPNYTPARPPETQEGRYSISADGRTLTLTEKGDDTQQITILRLSRGEMKWQYRAGFQLPLVMPKPIYFRSQARFLKVATDTQ